MQDAGIQQIGHDDLRQRLVAFLRNTDRAAEYRHFLPGPEAVQQCSSTGIDADPSIVHDAAIELIPNPDERQHARWRKYLDRLENGAWADNVAVQGISEMLGLNFRVINTLTPDYIIDVQPSEGPSPHTVHLGQIEQWHFVALQKLPAVNETQAEIEADTTEDQEEQEAFKPAGWHSIPHPPTTRRTTRWRQHLFHCTGGKSETLSYTIGQEF